MTDTTLFRVMGVLQLLIAFINFYVALQAAKDGSVFGLAMAALCVSIGVITTVLGAKMMGVID